jgi:hypothetical protein
MVNILADCCDSIHKTSQLSYYLLESNFWESEKIFLS